MDREGDVCVESEYCMIETVRWVEVDESKLFFSLLLRVLLRCAWAKGKVGGTDRGETSDSFRVPCGRSHVVIVVTSTHLSSDTLRHSISITPHSLVFCHSDNDTSLSGMFN